MSETIVLDGDWPDWIIDKYPGINWEVHNGMTVFSSRWEGKMYGGWAGLFIDVQKVLNDRGWFDQPENERRVVVAQLHECGGVDRTEIHRDRIQTMTPDGWWDYHHDYCYGCQDFANQPPMT